MCQCQCQCQCVCVSVSVSVCVCVCVCVCVHIAKGVGHRPSKAKGPRFNSWLYWCCYCFLEQETLHILLQSTQMYKWDLVNLGVSCGSK